MNAIALLALTPVAGTTNVAPPYGDIDRDGIPDHVDLDPDGDGFAGAADLFPFDPQEYADVDGDGIGDSADPDDDGDGLTDPWELEYGLDSLDVDTDGDRFVDGYDGWVLVDRLPEGWNLDGDGHVDGEADYESNPLDPADHPGKPGDVAPLGRPNARIDAADALVATRIAQDGALLSSMTGQNRAIAELAADEDGDGQRDAGDAQRVLLRARSALEAP